VRPQAGSLRDTLVRVPLRDETVERVLTMWQDRNAVHDNVSVVELAGERFVAAPPHVRAQLDGVEPEVNAVLAALGRDAAVVGDARLAFADDATFRARPIDGVERIADDDPRLHRLATRADTSEWLEASADEPADARYAAFEGGQIVAIATYGAWHATVGGIGVFTDAAARGRGLAGRVATAAVAEVFGAGLIAQWQSHVRNAASARVADKLGFVALGGRQIIRVRPAAGGSRTMGP
jgi:RimJ/RimL family protein N-acetyltransferase